MSYKEQTVTIDELLRWKLNKLINPRTKRKITLKSKIYKYLDKELKNLESIKKNELNWEDCLDDKDPVTMEYIWKYENKKKKKGEINDDEIIYYIDRKNLVRGIKITSLIQLNDYKFNKHPITNDPIPNYIFDLAKKKYKILIAKNKDFEIKKTEYETLDQKALQVFQKLSLDTFFIDHIDFLKSLDDNNLLIKLNNEIKDIFQKNISIQEKNKIYPPNGKAFNKTNLKELTNEEFKNYILDDFNIILDNGKKNPMIKYIIVGSLSLVVDKIKEVYGDGFSFSFII